MEAINSSREDNCMESCKLIEYVLFNEMKLEQLFGSDFYINQSLYFTLIVSGLVKLISVMQNYLNHFKLNNTTFGEFFFELSTMLIRTLITANLPLKFLKCHPNGVVFVNMAVIQKSAYD